MFDKMLFLAFVHSGDIAGMTQQLDFLLSDYLEENHNESFWGFRNHLAFLSENSRRNYIRKSVFHNELIQFPKLTEL